MQLFLQKKRVLIVSALLIALFAALLREPEALEAFGAQKNTAFDASRAHEYSLTLELDVQTHTLLGDMRVSYYNAERAALPEAAFHLYANGYQTEPPMNALRYSPDGFEPGSTVLTAASVGGESVQPRYINGDMLVIVPFLKPLMPNRREIIELSFETRVPKNRMRFGYSDFGYNVTGAYPVAAVPVISYGGGAPPASPPSDIARISRQAASPRPRLSWPTHAYPEFGDPFYTSAARYNVTLTLPAEFTAACTGRVVGESNAGGKKTLTLEAPGAREFAFCASRAFIVERAKTKGVDVELYALSKTDPAVRKKALDAAKNAVAVFVNRFGPYPFSRLCVAESGLLDGGMEYPGLVLIDTTLFSSGYERYLEHIVVHEAAHQWWYALVGSEQYAEPWLDEALTEYSTSVYYGDHYGEEKRKQLFQLYESDMYIAHAPAMRGGGALSDYPDAVLYSRSVYAEGAKMYEALRAKMGDGAFFAALREYAEQNAYGLAKGQNLLEALARHGADLAIVERFLG